MKYGYVLEPGQKRWFAYVPDLPGCTAAGRTVEEAARNVAGAADAYVAALRETGQPIPAPSPTVEANPETEPGFQVIQPGQTPTGGQIGKKRVPLWRRRSAIGGKRPLRHSPGVPSSVPGERITG